MPRQKMKLNFKKRFATWRKRKMDIGVNNYQTLLQVANTRGWHKQRHRGGKQSM